MRTAFVSAMVGFALVAFSVSPGEETSRTATLEDIFGPTGDRFRAAVGMINSEKASAATSDPAVGFGVSIDDPVFEWREFNLVTDDVDCAVGGSCATIEVASTNFYEGSGVLTITVVDSSPSNNDCNDDGDNTDLDDDTDCDNDGTPDVRVEVQSEAELNPGEYVTLNRVGTTDEYRGSISISASLDAPGLLFIRPNGTDNPTVTLTYFDYNDGTCGTSPSAVCICKNDVDPQSQGRVQTATEVFLTSGDLTVLNTMLADNGDGDAWADTNETVEMRIRVANNSGQDLTNVVARLASSDPKVDCIIDPFLTVGDLAHGATALSAEAFRFRVADAPLVDRSGADSELDDLSVALDIILSADEIDASSTPQSVVLDLDLNASGGSGGGPYFEGFEVAAGLGSFTTMNLDLGHGRNSPLDPNDEYNENTGLHTGPSDGKRCQYHDPDFVHTASYGQIDDCWVGATPEQADAYFWQVHQTTDIDGGRAFSGTRSLYMGIFGPAADEHTTPMGNLEAVGSENPINLAVGFCSVTTSTHCGRAADCPSGETCDSVSSELSFKHQISGIDSRSVNAPVGESADRAVVHVQLASSAGNAVGDWVKLRPYANVYDQQGTDNYTNCLFDPSDDGNTEDDFFDPTDPDRQFGPSSTCFPEFSFVFMGDTFGPFSAGNLGNAEGPGLAGALGIGTWVESKFNMERFRGRRLRLRFLNTALKAGSAETYEQIFEFNPDPGDDGWWIDDVTLTNALTSPATVTPDTANMTLPICPPDNCQYILAALTATPSATPAPGQTITLDASGSAPTTVCLGGTLQYRFSSNTGGLLRDYSDNAEFKDAPSATTIYTVSARCSTDTACEASTAETVAVACPSSGAAGLFQTVTAAANGDFVWTSAANTLGYSGDLALLSASYPGTGSALGTTASYTPPAAGPGAGTYHLFRYSGPLDNTFCNAGATWSGGSAAELPGARDATIP